jgi:hypothetical protein
MYELTEQFKNKANHLHPEVISFAVMMGEHGDEIANELTAGSYSIHQRL